MSDRSPETWSRLLVLLDTAFENRPDDPLAWLQEHPPQDEGLLALAREILHRARQDDGILDQSLDQLAKEAIHELAAGPGRGARLGSCVLEEEIGRGGMGVVYRARRVDGEFSEKVVVKLLPPAMDTPQRRARFLLERQLLSALRHPHIAHLLDGGFSPAGQPYLVLEFVEGQRVDLAADERGLDLDARLRLFLSILEAVAHAHRNLVVHRDLKPSNVLVTPDGHVKLLDFGIAKVLEENPAAGLTGTGLPMMTPEYASPEQVRGETMTTAVDVYQLGLLLYLLVTGVQPQSGAGDSVAKLQRMVCEVEIPRASSVCRHRWKRRLRGDLDRILQRALAKDPAHRYPSADTMAEDLRRHLDGLPVSARADSPLYRAVKFVGRHRMWAAVITTAVLGALLFGVFYTTRVREERQRAEMEARQRDEVASLLVWLFSAAGEAPGRAEEISARELLERGAERIRTELKGQPRLQAETMGVIGEAIMKVGLYEIAAPLLEESLAGSVRLFGEASEPAQMARRRLGELQLWRRDFEAAAATWTRIREIEDRGGAKDPRQRALSLQRLGIAERELGRLPQSRRHLEEALALLGRTEPADSLRVLQVETDLAALLRRQGAWEEAEARYRTVLAQARRLRQAGVEEVDLGPILNNLGFLLRRRGRYEEAERYYRECAEHLAAQFGPGHPTTVMVRNNLAAVLENLDRREELEDLLRETLHRVREFQGEENWRVARAEENLARVERARGAVAQALVRYEKAEAILRRDLGPGHPWTLCAAMDRAVSQELLRSHSAAAAFDSLEKSLDGAEPDRRFSLRLDHAEKALQRGARPELARRLARWKTAMEGSRQ